MGIDSVIMMVKDSKMARLKARPRDSMTGTKMAIDSGISSGLMMGIGRDSGTERLTLTRTVTGKNLNSVPLVVEVLLKDFVFF
jgi:hypothetical protein